TGRWRWRAPAAGGADGLALYGSAVRGWGVAEPDAHVPARPARGRLYADDDGQPAVVPAPGADRDGRAGWRLAGEVLPPAPAGDPGRGGGDQSPRDRAAASVPGAGRRRAVARAPGRWRPVRARVGGPLRHPAGRRLRPHRHSSGPVDPGVLRRLPARAGGRRGVRQQPVRHQRPRPSGAAGARLRPRPDVDAGGAPAEQPGRVRVGRRPVPGAPHRPALARRAGAARRGAAARRDLRARCRGLERALSRVLAMAPPAGESAGFMSRRGSMMRHPMLRAAALLLLVFALPVLAANGGMTLEQLATLRTVTQATVSPDGGR